MIPALFRIASCAVLAATTVSLAAAHDVWLTLEGDAPARRVVINYGHPDDRPPAQGEKVVDLFVIDGAARTSLADGLNAAQVGGNIIALSRPFADSGHALIAARYDNGVWVRTPDGHYRNASRRLVHDAAETLWSAKFAKAVTGPGAEWSTVLNHDLELTPLSDPAALRPGDTLRLRVSFMGKPLAGAEVERGDGLAAVPEKDIPRFASDADGIAAVPITKGGPQLLVVDHRIKPSMTPGLADADLFTGTLWFQVPTAP